MNASSIALRTSFAAGFLCAPALAQTPATHFTVNQMQGMMSNAAVGFVRSDPSGTTELVVRGAGTQTGAPTQWSVARFGVASEFHPDYSQATLLAGINRLVPPNEAATTLGFGGISTGGDICPQIDTLGRLQVGNSWYFLSVTVGAQASSTPYGLPGTVF